MVLAIKTLIESVKEKGMYTVYTCISLMANDVATIDWRKISTFWVLNNKTILSCRGIDIIKGNQ